MLKNIFKQISVRNFIQSGYYYDYFIKKNLSTLFTQSVTISVIFLEKYIIEYFFKNIKNGALFYNQKKNIFYKPFIITLCFINIVFSTTLIYVTC